MSLYGDLAVYQPRAEDLQECRASRGITLEGSAAISKFTMFIHPMNATIAFHQVCGEE
jgi:hypothetical protein